MLERVFLGWNAPALESASTWLRNLSQSGDHLNLDHLTVVSLGQRSLRLLEERLVRHAADSGTILSPPTCVTTAGFYDLLTPPSGRMVAPYEEVLLWRRVLAKFS